MDFPDDCQRGVYQLETVDAMMKKLRDMGVRRVYWNYYGPYDDGYVWLKDLPAFVHSPRNSEHSASTYRQLGNVIRVAVQAAKRNGLEIYAVMKPYETGTSCILPEGSPEAQEYGVLSHLGSRILQVDKFVSKHPEMRIRRRSDDLPPGLVDMPIETIRLYKSDNSPTRIKKKNIEIWTSENNYRYQKKKISFDFVDDVMVAPRDFTDMEGNLVTAKGTPVRVLSLSKMNLRDRYILVTTNFEDGLGDFENAAQHLISAFGRDRKELPTSVGHGLSIWCSEKIGFRDWGIEFDNGLSRRVIQLDAPNRSPVQGPWSVGLNGFVAVVRGRNSFLPAALCAGYSEVRSYWLSKVKACLDAGVDGVDFRIENHCCHTDDPFAFGYNEIVLEEYSRRFPEESVTAPIDAGHLSEIQGEHFDKFLEGAVELIHEYGKRTQVHLNVEFLCPKPQPSRHLAYPWNIRFNWRDWLARGWFDEATLRTFSVTPGFVLLEDAFSREVIGACNDRGIPLHYNRYLNGSPDHYANELDQVFKDGRFGGFIVYETAELSLRPDAAGGVKAVGGFFEAVRHRSSQLGL